MSRLTALVLDGPCAGAYDIRRASRRMVFTRAADGRCYALDEPGDHVEPDEDAFIYETDGSIGWICGREPARTLTFQIAASMDRATGEVAPLNPAQIEAERKAGRERVLAWAFGEAADDRKRTRGATSSHPVKPEQEALFS